MPMSPRMATSQRLSEAELSRDPIELCHARVFLEDYAVAVRMLRLCREDARERASLGRQESNEVAYYGRVGGDEQHWLGRAREVRAFIDALPHRDSKLFLYYHYVRGLTVEETAEELDIGVRTAYRRKRKAIAYAAHCLAVQARDGGVA